MRTPTPLLAVAALLAGGLLAGCSGDDAPASGPGPAASTSAAPGDVPTEPPASGTPEVAASPACAEVRAGIDAFNVGDFDETVARFEAAVPLVEGQADGSTASNELVEAVRWYAALPAEDYPEASRTSEEFQRYKAITLGQCIDALLRAPDDDAPGEAA